MGCVSSRESAFYRESQHAVDASRSFAFGYEDHNGPHIWPQFFPESLGSNQSPINVQTSQVLRKKMRIKFSYEPSTFVATHTGNTIEWADTTNHNKLRISDDIFTLLNFHLHIPSEHTLNGVRSDLEFQFLHVQERTGEVALIAILFDISDAPNEFFNSICTSLPFHQNDQSKRVEADLSLAKFEGKHFFYRGSLTRPPCTEGVQWFIHQKVHYLSSTQFKKLALFIPKQNFRPWFPIGFHRKIFLVEFHRQTPDGSAPEESSGSYGFEQVDSETTDYRLLVQLEEETSSVGDHESSRMMTTSKVSVTTELYSSFYGSRASTARGYRSWSEDDVSDVDWAYGESIGPMQWEEYFPDSCGIMQSPVEIKRDKLYKQDAKINMEFHYGHTVVMAENNGRFLSWTCQRNNGFLRLNGIKLTLRRFIIHTPAEHVIDGHRAQLELQLFHSTHPNSNRYSVISILFEDSEYGPRTPKGTNKMHSKLMTQLCSEYTLCKDIGDTRSLSVNLGKLNTVGSYVQYNGSLTHPPCTEGQKWYVNCIVKSMPVNQLKTFRECVPSANARPIQPLGNRKLFELMVGDYIE